MDTLCNGQDSWGYSDHPWTQNMAGATDSTRTSMCSGGHYDLHTAAMTSTQGYYGHHTVCTSGEVPHGMQLPVQLPKRDHADTENSQIALQVWEQYRRSQMLRGHFLHHNHHHQHHPHPHTIARRNERERNRVKTINSTFSKLRQHLPCSSKTKKLSKVQILRSAIQYINQLSSVLKAQDEEAENKDILGKEAKKGDISECDDSVSLVSSSSHSVIAKTELDGGNDDMDDDDVVHDDDDDLENFSSWLQ